MYCESCGRIIDNNSKFCAYCGSKCTPIIDYNQFVTPQKNKKKLAIIISSISATVIVALVIILVVALNSSNHSIIGKWYSSNDYVLDFRESGYLVYRDDRLDTFETKYNVSGDILHIDKTPQLYDGDFQYSELAKKLDDKYWYIEDDTLYLGRRAYFKK